MKVTKTSQDWSGGLMIQDIIKDKDNLIKL